MSEGSGPHKQSVPNPFDLNTVPDNLVNIASGRGCVREIEKSLNEFRDVSQEAVNQYVSERLSNERSVKFGTQFPVANSNLCQYEETIFGRQNVKAHARLRSSVQAIACSSEQP